MRRLNLFLLLLSLSFMAAYAQKSFHLKSPDSKLSADIVVGKTIHYSVSHQGDAMLLPSAISMNL